jgi:hypothetical protein
VIPIYFAHPVPFCLPVSLPYRAWIRTDAQNLILAKLVPLTGLPTGYTAPQLPRLLLVSSVDLFRANDRENPTCLIIWSFPSRNLLFSHWRCQLLGRQTLVSDVPDDFIAYTNIPATNSLPQPTHGLQPCVQQLIKPLLMRCTSVPLSIF